MTRGDKIRNMTDEQIVDAAFDIGIDDLLDFCQERPECTKVWAVLVERCKKCMLECVQKED